ncbi:MAG: MerR family transcriptional regulator [Anderseniella sp.]|jgi:DNA-binding transcriptional MerR regulator|nr:MerR family transcriptional regulator [Anderseniella sp.]
MTEATQIVDLVRKVIADGNRAEPAETVNVLTTNAVTKKLGLTARAVRFYSEQGIAHPIRRGSSRLFNPAQVRRLELARELRGIGMDVKSVVDTLANLTGPGTEGSKLAALGKQFSAHAEELRRREQEVRNQQALTTRLAKELAA